jgi:hypothetical protein
MALPDTISFYGQKLDISGELKHYNSIKPLKCKKHAKRIEQS